MKTKYIGVYQATTGRYYASIFYNGKSHYIGAFDTDIEAHTARMKVESTIKRKKGRGRLKNKIIKIVTMRQRINEKNSPINIKNQWQKVDNKQKAEKTVTNGYGQGVDYKTNILDMIQDLKNNELSRIHPDFKDLQKQLLF